MNGSEREKVCESVCESMWSDIRIIRKAVLTGRVKLDAARKAKKKAKDAAKKQGQPVSEAADLPSLPTGRTLSQVIDLMEGDEGFEGFEEAVDGDGDSVMSDEV
jgi:hypothetical protein